MKFFQTAVGSLFVATAAGAAVGVAALTGAVAHADPSNSPFTLNDFNNWPTSDLGYFSNSYTSHEAFPSIPYLYNGSKDTLNWQLFDNASHDNVIGGFDSTSTSQTFGGFPFSYQTLSNVVTDSTGTGLPEGTTWDSDSFNLVNLFPVYSFELFGSHSIDVPDQMSVDFFQLLGLGYESVVSDAGTTGFLYAFGDFYPLFDIPAGP